MVKSELEFNDEEKNDLVDFSLTNEVIVKACSRIRILLFGLGIVLLLSGIAELLFFNKQVITCVEIGFAIFFMMYSHFGTRNFRKRLAKKLLEKSEKENTGSKEYFFDEDEIRILSEISESQYKWDAIKKVEVFRHYIFIQLIDRRYIIVDINKLSAQESHELVNLFTKKIGIDDSIKLSIFNIHQLK